MNLFHRENEKSACSSYIQHEQPNGKRNTPNPLSRLFVISSQALEQPVKTYIRPKSSLNPFNGMDIHGGPSFQNGAGSYTKFYLPDRSGEILCHRTLKNWFLRGLQSVLA